MGAIVNSVNKLIHLIFRTNSMKKGVTTKERYNKVTMPSVSQLISWNQVFHARDDVLFVVLTTMQTSSVVNMPQNHAVKITLEAGICTGTTERLLKLKRKLDSPTPIRYSTFNKDMVFCFLCHSFAHNSAGCSDISYFQHYHFYVGITKYLRLATL